MLAGLDSVSEAAMPFMKRQCWFILLAVALTAVLVGTQDATGQQRELLPVHQIEFDDGPEIGPVVFSPNGNSIYVLLHPQAVNVWAILVSRWPEILGVAVAIVLLSTTLVAWRIVRRKVIPGKQHCRRCRYCLEGAPSSICPECGYDHSRKRPIVGKALWRRMTPAMGIALIVLGAYGSLWVARVPRMNIAGTWFDWWSVGCLEWAKQRSYADIVTQARQVNRIIEVDVLSGTVVRELTTGPGGWGAQIQCGPNGKWIVTTLGSDLALVSVGSGRVMRRLNLRDSNSWGGGWNHLDGFSKDGHRFYAVWFDQMRKRTQLVEWHLHTGKARILFETGADVSQAGGFEQVDSKRLFHVESDTQLWVVEVPSGPVTQDAETKMIVHDTGHNGRIIQTIIGRIWFWRDPFFSSDGRRMYWEYPNGGLSAFRSCDIETGAPITFSGTSSLPSTALILGAHAYRAQRIYLRIHGGFGRSSIVIADMQANQMTGPFPIAPHRINPDSQAVSPNGKHLAVVGWMKEGPVRDRKLYLYELSDIDGAEDK